MYHWGGRLARWWWREHRDSLLWDRAALASRGTSRISSRRGGVVRHRLPRSGVDQRPPWLVKNSIYKILSAAVARGHADVKLVKRDNELVEFRKGEMGR
jgi:hypothetical protein